MAKKSASQKSLFLPFLLVGLVAVSGAGMIFYSKKIQTPKVMPLTQSETQMITADFKCDGGKTIDATFVNGTTDSVELTLSDERKVNLPQTISADGGRYANWDESFVFWNKGNTAFIEEDNKTTYANCVTERSQ